MRSVISSEPGRKKRAWRLGQLLPCLIQRPRMTLARGTITTSISGSESANSRRCVARVGGTISSASRMKIQSPLALETAKRRAGSAMPPVRSCWWTVAPMRSAMTAVSSSLCWSTTMTSSHQGRQRREGVVELVGLVERDDDAADLGHG